jgi:isoleucyl-tRNA synthetase
MKDRTELDRWIVSELHTVISEVRDALDSYSSERATRRVEEFVEFLSNWYVRRSRRRFWKSENDEDKVAAHATLYECLTTLVKLVAPIMPFLAENMYQNLIRSTGTGKESVHLDDYPIADTTLIDQELSDAIRLAMRLSSLGRAARSKLGVKVRQPLPRIFVKLRTIEELALLDQIQPQILDELNLREFVSLQDVSEVAEFTILPNLAVLGPKYGSKLKDVRAAIASANPAQTQQQISASHRVRIGEFELLPEEILVKATDKTGYVVASESGYTVALSTEIPEELVLEGLARELVHRMQNMRKSAGFEIADRITTYYQGNDKVDEVLSSHRNYIMQETLSNELVRATPPKGIYVEEHDMDGLQITIGILRIDLAINRG